MRQPRLSSQARATGSTIDSVKVFMGRQERLAAQDFLFSPFTRHMQRPVLRQANAAVPRIDAWAASLRETHRQAERLLQQALSSN